MSFINKILLKKPSMYTSSVVLNVLGAQPIRTFYLWARRSVHPKLNLKPEYRGALIELEKNGAVVIPNFLSPEDYAKFKAEFDTLSPNFPPDYSEIALPHVDRLSIHDAKVSSFTKKLFLESPMIHALLLGYMRRKYHFQWNAYLTKIYLSQEELDKPKNGGTNNIHFDAPTRVLKFFYYVTDTTEENSALYYCKGTQKRGSLSRLWLEYKLSIRFAMNKWNPNNEGEYLAADPWVKLTPEEIKKYNLIEKPINVKGNTLVAADVGAFHRRGAFLKAGKRETLEINFREIETLRHTFYPLEQLFRKIVKKEKRVTAPVSASTM